jgi:glycosyl transferase family 25
MVPVYVINLDRSPERFRAIATRLKELSVPFERFSAVDGNALSMQDLESRFGFRLAPAVRPFTQGEIGCYLSHLSMLRKIAADCSFYGCVIEDDAEVAWDFRDILARIEELALDGIVKLESQIRRRARYGVVLHEVGRRRLVVPVTALAGSAAYVVSREAAAAAAEVMVVMTRSVDRVLFERRANRHELFEVWPHPINQDKKFSSLVRPNTHSLGKTSLTGWSKVRRAIGGVAHIAARYGIRAPVDLRALQRSTLAEDPF